MGKGAAGGKVPVEAVETPRLCACRDDPEASLWLDGQDEPITGVQVEPPAELGREDKPAALAQRDGVPLNVDHKGIVPRMRDGPPNRPRPVNSKTKRLAG